MNAYVTAMRRYVDFSGRSSRSEFWLYVLFYFIIYIIAGIIDAFVFGRAGRVGILTTIVALVHLLPSLAVSVRRLHDIDRTGWWVLVFALAPFVVTMIALLAAGGSMFAMMSGQGGAGAAAGFGVAMAIAEIIDIVILIVALVFYCTRGTAGSNRFGSAPA